MYFVNSGISVRWCAGLIASTGGYFLRLELSKYALVSQMESAIRAFRLLFLFYLYGIVSCSQDLLQKNCITANGENGVCVKMEKCNSVKNPSLQPNSVFSSVCSIGSFEYGACCPLSELKNNNEQAKRNQVERQAQTAYQPLYPPQCGSSFSIHNRVVGGSPASLGTWPWIAAVGFRYGDDTFSDLIFECGGALVSSRHVVTAAHCMEYENTQFVVRLGEYDLANNNDGANPIDFDVESLIVHPNYNALTKENDVAVLKLSKDVAFTHDIKPICLPLTDDIKNRNFTGNFPFIAGWGVTSYDGPLSDVLLEAQVPVVTNESCKKSFEKKVAVIDDRVICAGYDNGEKDACQGDSGGPLMLPLNQSFYLIGIVSTGFRCATPGYPGIYTRVTQFLDFITFNLQ